MSQTIHSNLIKLTHELVAVRNAFHQEVFGALLGSEGDGIAKNTLSYAHQKGSVRFFLQQLFRLFPGDDPFKWEGIPPFADELIRSP